MAEESGTEEFKFEFYSKVADPEDALRIEAETRLRKLAEGHDDLIGASVTIEEPSQKEETPHVFRAKVVAYTRPRYIVGEEKGGHPRGALKGALSAVERQVREKREKLRMPFPS